MKKYDGRTEEVFLGRVGSPRWTEFYFLNGLEVI